MNSDLTSLWRGLQFLLFGGDKTDCMSVFRSCVQLTNHSGACSLACLLTMRSVARPLKPQDIYKYVTHEKGILGSQGDYNARHRRLCQPPFRSKTQLEKFAKVVVQR